MIIPQIKDRLANYSLEFTEHVRLRLVQRQIDEEIVVRHLHSLDHLKLIERQTGGHDEEKYKLWFVPRKRIAYIYVVAIKDIPRKVIVITAIKQRLYWQRKVQHNG